MPETKSFPVTENPCRALLVIDDQKVRAQALRKARSSLRRLEKLEQTAKNFDGRDQELFNAWRDEALAEVNREAENLRAEVKKVQERHYRTRELSHHRGLPIIEALEQVRLEESWYEAGNLDRKRELEAIWAERERIFREYLDERDRREREEDERQRKAWEEKNRKYWEEEWKRRREERQHEKEDQEEPPPGEEEAYDHADGWRIPGEDCWQRFAESPTTPTPLEEEELKLRYRQLVKELHPDKKGPGSTSRLEPWQQRLWEDAKKAVEDGDLARMNYTYAMAMLRLGRLEQLTVGEIQGCARWFDAEKDSLKLDNQERRRSPVWNFSGRKNLLSLYWKLRRSVDKETEQLKMMLLSFEWREARWKKENDLPDHED